LCGVVITFAVRLAGVVVVFCFLIIPATVSALLASQWHVRLLIAWAVGTAASVAGLLFCHGLDFSAGVSVALFLGVFLLASVVGDRAMCLTRPRPS
jgi:zinc/manganese transport system permease protein